MPISARELIAHFIPLYRWGNVIAPLQPRFKRISVSGKEYLVKVLIAAGFEEIRASDLDDIEPVIYTALKYLEQCECAHNANQSAL